MEGLKNRLYQFVSHLNITVSSFEKSCNLGNGFVSKVGDTIRRTKLDLISKSYPELNIEWLKTGFGDMLNTDNSEVSRSKNAMPSLLPYYDVDITLGFDNIINDQTTIPSYYLNIPAFKNCDCAVPVYGRSMTPDINDGSIVAIKEVSLDSVLPGEAYLIVTDEYRTVKYIRTCKGDPTKLRLVPKNLEEFDEMILDKSKIRKVFMVKGVITNKIL